ncbi:SAM-dependent methyltransferase [Parabacteroides goldsteinii]|uniref:SAM-dependent methyltransferase n=1 Tax=Parabacteroides goldsteinii TaxID=328812 RepID=UPI0026196B7D|nr:SAM-dependent methyltransferase [Parabacteroides goldsteinii]
MQASLFLIPVTLGDTDHRRVLPEYNREIILQIKHFIVENIRTARRFLKKTEPSIVIDDLTFYELNKHTSPEDVAGYLVPLTKGEHVGVISNTIKKLEGRIYSENQTQLFIETPYRNNKLAEELIRTCRPSTKLCIASDITCEDEYIHTRPVKDWAGKVPDLSKKPTIFLIYK